LYRKYRVYFVDDEPLVPEQLVRKAAFSEYGYEIAGYTTDPEAAVGEIRSISPDVVFTAIKMPEMTGIELMDTLKSEQNKAEFVVLSTYKDLAGVRRYFNEYEFEYLIKPVEDKDLVNVLKRVSGKLSMAPPRTNLISSSKDLNEILAYLQDYSGMRHTRESISSRWGINPNTVCNLFAKHLDTTFIAYLTELRMVHAGELLVTTDKSIKEVAYLCGYNDYFFFCRVFKERNKCTPSQYRAGSRKVTVKQINYRNNRGRGR